MTIAMYYSLRSGIVIALSSFLSFDFFQFSFPSYVLWLGVLYLFLSQRERERKKQSQAHIDTYTLDERERGYTHFYFCFQLFIAV